MSLDIHPGMTVRIRAQGLSGNISAFWGEKPNRRVIVNLPDGGTVTVVEGLLSLFTTRTSQ